MNILIYSKSSAYLSYRFGGVETSLKLIAQGMARRGHKVTYLTHDPGLVERLKVVEIDRVTVIFYGKFKKTRWRKLRSKFKRVDLQKDCFLELIKSVMGKEKFDLVYTYYDLLALDCFIQVKEYFPYKLVMRMAGLKWVDESLGDSEKKACYEDVFNSVDSINYNTPGLESLCIRSAKQIGLRYLPKHSFVADVGGEVSMVEKLSENSFSRGDTEVIKLLVATRFSTYQKRQDILINALAIAKESIRFKLVLVGDGPRRDAIQDLIVQLGLEDLCEVVPFLAQEDLWSLMRDSDLLCHPCEYEGLSKIIVESMLMGVPVLASDVEPLNDYIDSDETGFLVGNEVKCWADKLVSLYEDRAVLSQVSERAKLYAEQNFDPEKNINDYEKAFSKLILFEKR